MAAKKLLTKLLPLVIAAASLGGLAGCSPNERCFQVNGRTICGQCVMDDGELECEGDCVEIDGERVCEDDDRYVYYARKHNLDIDFGASGYRGGGPGFGK